jgi:anthranilate phosphoribosyltransferase
LLGVFHPDLVGIQVRVLQRLGSKRVMVTYGLEGLDEISISGPTLVGELANGEIREYELHPSQFGLELYDRRAIQVGTVEESKSFDSGGAAKPAGSGAEHRAAERGRSDLRRGSGQVDPGRNRSRAPSHCER